MMPGFADQLHWIDHQRDSMVELLERWSSINSGSHNLIGLEAFSQQILPMLKQLSPQIEQIDLPPQVTVDDEGRAQSHPLGKALAFRSPPRTAPAAPPATRVFLGIHY